MTRNIVARPVVEAIKFVGQMFKDRGYDLTERKLVYDKKLDMWEMSTQTKSGEKVLAAFSKCKAFGDVLQLEAYTPASNTGYQSDDEVDSFDQKKSSKTKSLDVDFVRRFIVFAQSKGVKILVLVTDLISKQAVKHMRTAEGLKMTHFTYDETGIASMAQHVSQPTVFRPLTPTEKAAFISDRTRNHCGSYLDELERCSVDDPLVKYYGLHADDVVYLEDYDSQSGLDTSYILVVEEL